jgi:hypothetical protein
MPPSGSFGSPGQLEGLPALLIRRGGRCVCSRGSGPMAMGDGSGIDRQGVQEMARGDLRSAVASWVGSRREMVW